MFTNLGIIRRYYIDKCVKFIEKKKLEKESKSKEDEDETTETEA